MINVCESAFVPSDILYACQCESDSAKLLFVVILGSHLDNALVSPSLFPPRFWSQSAWIFVIYWFFGFRHAS